MSVKGATAGQTWAVGVIDWTSYRIALGFILQSYNDICEHISDVLDYVYGM